MVVIRFAESCTLKAPEVPERSLRNRLYIVGESIIVRDLLINLKGVSYIILMKSQHNSPAERLLRNCSSERLLILLLYSQVGMIENVTPSEGTLVTCLFYYITHAFARYKVVFSCRRGPRDLLRFSTVTDLTAS